MVRKSSKKSVGGFDCVSHSPSYRNSTNSQTCTSPVLLVSKHNVPDLSSQAAGSESISPLKHLPVPLQQPLGLRARHAPILPHNNMTFAMNNSSCQRNGFSIFQNSGLPSPPHILPAATPATFLGYTFPKPQALSLENRQDADEEIETDSSTERLTLKPTPSQSSQLLPEAAHTPETILAQSPASQGSPPKVTKESDWNSKRPTSAGEGPSGRTHSPTTMSTMCNSARPQSPSRSRHSRNASAASTLSLVSNCTHDDSIDTSCNSCASSPGSTVLAITTTPTVAESPKRRPRARRNANVGLVPVAFGRREGIACPDMPHSPPKCSTAAAFPGTRFFSFLSTAPYNRNSQNVASPQYYIPGPPRSPNEPLLSRPPTSIGSAPLWPRYGNDDRIGMCDIFFGSPDGINWDVLVSTPRGKQYLVLGVCMFLVAVAATTVTWGFRDLITDTLTPTEVISVALAILGFDIVCALAGYRVLASAHKLVR